MTVEDIILSMAKTEISKLPAEDQKKVEAAAKKIRNVVAKSDSYGLLALALVDAEQAAK
jgi:hypothetical protein